MALITIPNQPIILNPDASCIDCGNPCFCQKYSLNDYLYWQAKQSPCEGQKVANNTFVTDGHELITNGSFTGSAAGWTLGGGWTYGSNKVTANDTNGTLVQSMVLTVNAIYKIVFTVSGRTIGSIEAAVGGAGIIPLSANGTFTQYIRAIGNDVQFLCAGGFDGSLDDVSLELVPFWTWDTYSDSWDFSNNMACASSDLSTLTNTNTVLVIGGYYKVTIRLLNSTQGSIIVWLGGTQYSFTGNGIYTVWLYAGGVDTSFKIIPDNFYDGCVSDISLYQLNTSFQAFLLNDQNQIIEDLTPFITYYQDWITIAKKWSEITGAYVNNCYKLAVKDPCNAAAVTGADLITNGSFTGSAIGWTLIGCASYGDNSVNIFPCLIPSQVKQLFPVTPGCYTFTFQVSNFISGNCTPIVAGINLPMITDNGTFTYSLYLPAGGNNVSFVGDLTCHMTIDNVSLLPTLCYNNVSNCLCYATSWGCSYLVDGYSDNAAFGFEFIKSGFRLRQRLEFFLSSALYRQQQDAYLYSNGVNQVDWAQSSKYRVLFFEKVPEYVHDVIALQRILKHFSLGNATDTLVEYFTFLQDYQPEWPKGLINAYAPSRFEVVEKTQTLFESYCAPQ